MSKKRRAINQAVEDLERLRAGLSAALGMMRALRVYPSVVDVVKSAADAIELVVSDLRGAL